MLSSVSWEAASCSHTAEERTRTGTYREVRTGEGEDGVGEREDGEEAGEDHPDPLDTRQDVQRERILVICTKFISGVTS